MTARHAVTLTVDGTAHTLEVEPRRLLSDVLREQLGLKGVHVGCEHGVCGACTILVDGQPQRSCLIFAIQLDGSDIETVEGLAGPEGELHPLQQSFWDAHGLQCGFCTPGVLMSAKELLERNPDPTDEEIRVGLAGNLCRCTGYVHIVDAVRQAAATMREERA